MVRIASLLLAAGAAAWVDPAEFPGSDAVSHFDRVYLDGPVTLNVSQGDTTKVSIRGAGSAGSRDDLLVEVVDGVLYVDATGLDADDDDVIVDVAVTDLAELVSQGATRVRATALNVDSLTVEGGGDFRFEDLQARELMVVSKGAASFEVDGRVEHQIVDAAGAVDYDASALASATSEVRLAGAGHLTLWVEDLLAVRIAGTATVSYRGSPTVHKRVLGVGRVERIN